MNIKPDSQLVYLRSTSTSETFRQGTDWRCSYAQRPGPNPIDASSLDSADLRLGMRTAQGRRSELSLRPLIGVDDVPGLVLLGSYDGNHGKVLERLQVAALDVVELHGHDEWLG